MQICRPHNHKIGYFTSTKKNKNILKTARAKLLPFILEYANLTEYLTLLQMFCFPLQICNDTGLAGGPREGSYIEIAAIKD